MKKQKEEEREVEDDDTPPKPREYSIASNLSSEDPTPKTSIVSGIDIPKSSSPLLQDVRKNRPKPAATMNKKKKSLGETEKRLKKAEENRLKLQQVLKMNNLSFDSL